MSISAIILTILTELAVKSGFDPNNFLCRIDPLTPDTQYEVRLDYIPKDFHRVFKLNPYYESMALSNYMIKHQVTNQVMIFLEELKNPEELK